MYTHCTCIKTKFTGNVREVWVLKGKLPAGLIATVLKTGHVYFPPGDHHTHYGQFP